MLMHTNRIEFLDLQFDRATFEQVKAWLRSVTPAKPYGYVVTPNVDLTVRAHREQGLSQLYSDADLCVCDSRILRLLARTCGIKLPLVPGSDLAATTLSQLAKSGDTIAVVGSTPISVSQLRDKFPAIKFVHHEPPMGLRQDPIARRAAAEFIASSGARFTLLAVGSPQQEMIANEVGSCPGAGGIALCIGAGLDFITGEQKRAPKIIQKLSLEWAHRLASNPRRLWRRYLVEGVRIFPIYAKWRARNLSRRSLTIVAAVIGGAGLVLLGVLWERAGRTAGSVTATVPQPAGIAQIQLPPPNLLKPLTPQQAAEQNAERPFVGRPDSPAAKFILHTDEADRERALNCLAQAVYYEAASEGAEGGRAVAQVVLNRMRHPGYPASVCGVVYQGADRPSGCQFTFTCDGSLLRTPVAALWTRSRKIAQDALAGRVFAPVGHATHYHADYVLPYWADSLDKSVEIGRHIFYRLRSSLGDSDAFSQRYAGVEPEPPRPAQPGATVVIPSTAVTEQLANALIGDEVNNGPQQVEKASAQPISPLLVDTSPASLVADSGFPKPLAPKAKSARDCPTAIDDKRISPLRPNDVRSSVAPSPAC